MSATWTRAVGMFCPIILIAFIPVASARAQTDSKRDVTTQSTVIENKAPAKAKYELQKGIEAFRKGDSAQAQEHFEKAIVIYPQYAEAYDNLGVMAVKSGERGKARDYFSKAIEVDGKFFPGYVDLARMDYQEKNYRAAEATLHKVLEENPSIPDAVALLAAAEFGNKDYDDALADAQRVHMFPHHEQFAGSHLIAAEVLEIYGRNPEAIIEYQMFLKEAPESPQIAQVKEAITRLQAAQN
jgi:Tfp pilus assembly protein PilF